MTVQHAETGGLILVVIPTLNEARTIRPVMDALSRDLPAGRSVRFCVADGGSTDGTQEIVRTYAASRPDLSLVNNPKRFQSAGINLAVEMHGAQADWLVRCDAHSVYPKGFVRRLMETQARTGADAVVVPMDSAGRDCMEKAVAWASDTKLGSGGSAHRGGRRSGFVDHGHHALMRTAAFRRAGGYDESFSHNEDAELDCRIRALGGRIFLDGETRLEYHPRGTFGRLWKQYFAYGKGRSRTVRRHPSSLRLRQFAVPAFIALCCLALLAAPFQPWALVIPGFYAAVLAATSLSVALKKRSTCGLLAGPAALTMHASWAAGFLAGLLTVRERRWRADAMRLAGGTA